MALRFTDQHAMSLVAPHLFPGEQVLFRARGFEKPWYSYVFSRLGSFLWKYWLVVGTNQRLVFVQHGGLLGGYSAKRHESFAWSELDRVDIGWGFFSKNLKVGSKAKRLSRTVIVPRGWMRGNFDAAKGMNAAWQQNRHSMPPGPMPIGALPVRV
jgi:hypothetical protein